MDTSEFVNWLENKCGGGCAVDYAIEQGFSKDIMDLVASDPDEGETDYMYSTSSIDNELWIERKPGPFIVYWEP